MQIQSKILKGKESKNSVVDKNLQQIENYVFLSEETFVILALEAPNFQLETYSIPGLGN